MVYLDNAATSMAQARSCVPGHGRIHQSKRGQPQAKRPPDGRAGQRESNGMQGKTWPGCSASGPVADCLHKQRHRSRQPGFEGVAEARRPCAPVRHGAQCGGAPLKNWNPPAGAFGAQNGPGGRSRQRGHSREGEAQHKTAGCHPRLQRDGYG